MSDWNDWKPFDTLSGTVDLADKMNKARTTTATEKTAQLLEEQNRLQKEALELEKKKFAQEQEKIKLEREQLERQKHGQPLSPQPKQQDLPRKTTSYDDDNPREKAYYAAIDRIQREPNLDMKLRLLEKCKKKYEDCMPYRADFVVAVLGLSGALLEKTTSPMNRLYRLAYARGFLIKRQDNCIVMNDNAHETQRSESCSEGFSDWDELLHLTRGMVNVDQGRIVSCTDEFSAKKLYERLFEQKNRIENDVVRYDYQSSLEYFKSECTTEIPTYHLEPFVAMYVKALSSINVRTTMSCQGHETSAEMRIELAGKYHRCFHDAVWAVDEGLQEVIDRTYDNNAPIDGRWGKSLVFWPAGDRPLSFITGMSINTPQEWVLRVAGSQRNNSVFKLIRAGQYIYENRTRFLLWRERIVNEISSEDAELDVQLLTKRMVDIIND